MYSFKFQIPAYYTLLVRSLSVLEGIALASDTDYKVSLCTCLPACPRLLGRLAGGRAPSSASVLGVHSSCRPASPTPAHLHPVASATLHCRSPPPAPLQRPACNDAVPLRCRCWARPTPGSRVAC